MVDFDKFEQNVKNKYGNQEFPFDEQNWEKARKMIDASRQGKNRGGIFLLSAVALLCTTGLVYYFGFSGSSKPLEKNNLAVNQASEIKNNPEVADIKPEAVITENNTQSSEETNSSSNAAETKNTESSNLNTSNTNSSKINTTTKASGTSSAENKSETVNNNLASENNTKAAENTNTNPNNNTSETKTNNIKNTEAKKPAAEKSATQKATPPVLGSNNNTSGEIKDVNPSANTNTGGNTEKLGETNNSSTPQTTPTKNNTQVTDSSSQVVTATVKPGVADSLPKISKGRADSLAAMMPSGDGISYATNVKEKHNAKNILFAEIGTTYMLGWGSGTNNDANGFNLLGGVNFQHYFNGTMAAQIGVQYSTVANLTNTTHTISTVKYDLGMEQDVTRIKYQTLHYLVAPIKFTYNIKDKNIIGIGCNVGYLLNSDSKKEKYKTYSTDPNATKNNLTSSKESGYVQGFSPYDLQLALSYRRKIYKGLSANAEFFYGLTDTKDNSFFKTNNFDRNTGFKVSLCYDLFKK